MNTHPPIPEDQLHEAFAHLPKGALSGDFQQRVLAELDTHHTAKPATIRRLINACWLALAAASAAILAAIDWTAIEPNATAAIIAGGGLLLCLAALVFLLRIARARFIEFFWRVLID